MTFVADENVDRQIVIDLRRAGHSVFYIAEIRPGIPDEQVLELSRREEAVLITDDKDFGELSFRQQLVHAGILLVRLQGCPSEEKASIVVDAVNRFGSDLTNAFAVVNRRNIRIRKALNASH